MCVRPTPTARKAGRARRRVKNQNLTVPIDTRQLIDRSHRRTLVLVCVMTHHQKPADTRLIRRTVMAVRNRSQRGRRLDARAPAHRRVDVMHVLRLRIGQFESLLDQVRPNHRRQWQWAPPAFGDCIVRWDERLQAHPRYHSVRRGGDRSRRVAWPLLAYGTLADVNGSLIADSTQD